jgi:hypothetical protein
LQHIKRDSQQIADKNEIEYTATECHFEGECEGTCPKCDAELRYIENELNKRKHFGKVAAVASIALGMAMPFSGCIEGKPNLLEGDLIPIDTTYEGRDSFYNEYYIKKNSFPIEKIADNTSEFSDK